MSSPTAASPPATSSSNPTPRPQQEQHPNNASSFTGTLRTARPRGHLETIHDVPTYITRGTATSNSTIIFLTDSFGFKLVNNKLLADQYAARTGLRVLVPDLLPNGGAPLAMVRWLADVSLDAAWWNVAGQARRFWAGCRLMSVLVPFSYKVRRLYPTVLAYVRAVRASLPLGAKLGVAGFCLGGHWSSRLCGESALEPNPGAFHSSSRPPAQASNTGSSSSQSSRFQQYYHPPHASASHLIDAHFAAHPSNLGPEDAAAFAARFRVPWSMALGDRDLTLPPDQANKVVAGLRAVYRNEPAKLQVQTYEGCGHGFALREDPNKRDEDEAANRALEQAVAWFRRYLVSSSS